MDQIFSYGENYFYLLDIQTTCIFRSIRSIFCLELTANKVLQSSCSMLEQVCQRAVKKKTALTLEKEHPVQTCTYSTQHSKSCLNKPAFASRCYSQNNAQVLYVFAYFSSNVISMETSWLNLILDVETALQLLGNTLDHAKLAVSLSFQDLC